jgi:hypothetical protein
MKLLHRTALDNGIPVLYHYEKFNPKHLETTLREKIIHCSNPANLNDPWDCRPAFDPTSLEDPEALEREIAWRTEDPAKHLWAARMRADQKFRVDFIVGQSNSLQRAFGYRRIYCLTPKADSTLMWSHYADDHHGICLEFGVPTNMLFSKACEVMYREEYPKWVPSEFNDEPARVMEFILTKAADWSYEKEYRLISVPPAPSASFLHLHGDFYRLPCGALKSVTMGCEADHKAISDVIKTCDPDLPIKIAVRSPHLYKLDIVAYSPS